MKKIKFYAIVIHFLLISLFVLSHSHTLILMLLAPLFHLMVLRYNSSCYINHCHRQRIKTLDQQNQCEECGLIKWIRMRHCKKCQTCVHKFDHHCFLMGICIGQFNHKYYILFLYCYLTNTFIMIIQFHQSILNQVWVDQRGIEHFNWMYFAISFGLILLYFNAFLGLYLGYYHTSFMMTNETTWETAKRDSISYFRSFKHDIQHPFSKGCVNNIRQFIHSNKENPIDWKINQYHSQR